MLLAFYFQIKTFKNTANSVICQSGIKANYLMQKTIRIQNNRMADDQGDSLASHRTGLPATRPPSNICIRKILWIMHLSLVEEQQITYLRISCRMRIISSSHILDDSALYTTKSALVSNSCWWYFLNRGLLAVITYPLINIL